MSDSTGNWPKLFEKVVKVASVVIAVAAVGVLVTKVAAVATGALVGVAAGKAIFKAALFVGAALSGINGGAANESKGNSFANGYAGGFVGGTIQSYMSKNKGGTTYGGGIGVTVGTVVTDVLNNVDPDSANSSVSQIAKNAAISGGKAVIISSLTELVGSGVGGVNYTTGEIEGAVADGCGGLMPSLTLGFGEGIKAFFGWADDAVIYVWE